MIVDAITDANLMDIGKAAASMKLVTGGSGAALGLPANFVRAGLLKPADANARMTAPKGRAAILAGSCSEATRGQVAAAIAAGVPALKVDPLAIASGALGHKEIVRVGDEAAGGQARADLLERRSGRPCAPCRTSSDVTRPAASSSGNWRRRASSWSRRASRG